MAVSAHIIIDKELAVKGYRRALRYETFAYYFYWYGIRLAILWLFIAAADGIWGEKDLVPLHAGVLFLACLTITVYEYVHWYRSLEKTTVGWEFHAIIDDDGVRIKVEVHVEAEYAWDFYSGYREYDEYLEIRDSNNQITFVPKTPELADVVEFTKSKINRA